MQSNDRHHVYKSLETDTELRERVLKDLGDAGKYWRYDLEHASGDYLEAIVWDCFKKQRRIVERSTDKR